VLPLRDNVPTRRFAVITAILIAINIAVWVFYQLPNLEESVEDAAYFPCAAEGSCATPGLPWPLTVLTSMFMHGSWAHLLGNMLFLWIFGNNVEEAMGGVRYVVFYLLGGAVATATQSFVTLSFAPESDAGIPNVGASGAIAAVMGGYLVLLPRARILTLIGFFVIEVPALAYLAFWFLFQLWVGSFSILQPEAGGGVAFFAHAGGFAFGAVTVLLFAQRRPRERLA
jgi:membrane associated rhomboid family serine protease